MHNNDTPTMQVVLLSKVYDKNTMHIRTDNVKYQTISFK